ncbi:tRNA (adenosine(37)-N6)-threonylcarbamoyltransferase complex ATPase subunit type 1 TsaE [Candidatus Obscuribacterales bacterium]|jgi:tRNA threonylcarbamoyladenosine biosynthesis protein TsaE|nr:tRNA (adenosine(37)-N6)-threonylcarbamoyltransferase complex ATPase subunit type 1 TsaE [Candidatus Obscuribacterales bacterium]MBX3151969.1 tRNA (adenosine(37)-N6)-threonylcarbamoyltransferase complex ATPase subunit type 1 TsaE [Candidatus Obscuribacterales bacterium]
MSLEKQTGDNSVVEFTLTDVGATRELGRILAESLESGAVIALTGNLGAGKTTLVQALGKALGISEVISSPTFTMMNEYHSGRLPLFHFDFYRVMEMAERQEQDLSLDLVASEFDEISESGRALMMIEWPEYFRVEGANYLESVDRLNVTLTASASPDGLEDCRNVVMSATGAVSAALIDRLKSRVGDFRQPQ